MSSPSRCLSRRGFLVGAASMALAVGAFPLAGCTKSEQKIVVACPTSLDALMALVARDFVSESHIKVSLRDYAFGNYGSWITGSTGESLTAEADVVVLEGVEELRNFAEGTLDAAQTWRYVAHEPVFVVAEKYRDEGYNFDDLVLGEPVAADTADHAVSALAIIAKEATGEDAPFLMEALFGEEITAGIKRRYHYQYCWREGVADFNEKHAGYPIVAVESDALRAHTTNMVLAVRKDAKNPQAAAKFIEFMYGSKALTNLAKAGIGGSAEKVLV